MSDAQQEWPLTAEERFKMLFDRTAKLNDSVSAILAPAWGSEMGIIPSGHPLYVGEQTAAEEQGAPVDWRAIAEQRERELKQVGEARHRAETETARLRAGEEDGWDPLAEPTPGQWIARWNDANPAERLDVAQRVIENAGRASTCDLMAHEKRLEEDRHAWVALVRVRDVIADMEGITGARHWARILRKAVDGEEPTRGGGETTAPATTCSARYTGPDFPPGECIRAAGHQAVTDHTDDLGHSWPDAVAVYPVFEGGAGAEDGDPPVQCWHTEPGTPCDWNVCRQPERLAAGDWGTDPSAPLPAESMTTAAQPCAGLPDGCPNLRPVQPDPPRHDGGMQCACGDVREAEVQRDRYAGVLREVLAAFRSVTDDSTRTVVGYLSAPIHPDDMNRWRVVLNPPKEP